MTIVDVVLAELARSGRPEAKALHKGLQSKTQLFGFKKGMGLKEHETHMETTLFVLEGKVTYRETKQPALSVTLEKYHHFNIPVEVVHTLVADEDSLCLLIQG